MNYKNNGNDIGKMNYSSNRSIRMQMYAGIILMCFVLVIPYNIGSAVVQQDSLQARPVSRVFPKGYFVEPTDSSLKIAGNFGEIRPNHFHAGLDVKTGGREGAFIYAVADGYVSRIKISPFGYGKCLYITHPNGYVSTYAHLQRLYGKVADYLEKEQYKAETYDLDIYPEKNLLRVNQCDTVAISGNTGGSQSPHLHFEIRDEITEHAYNPFLFGYKIEDTVPPVISLLKIYTVTDSSSVNGRNEAKKIGVFGRKGRYHIPVQQLVVNGDIGFGIETLDYGNIKEAGKLGAYSIDMYIDGQRIYYHELNEIGFDESRYINAHIDYSENGKSGRQVQQCFRDENNMLSIYQCVLNDGLYRFADNNLHKVKFIVKDFFGNTSVLEFSVKSTEKKIKRAYIPRMTSDSSLSARWDCCEMNTHETEQVKVEIDPCGLYEDIDFKYSMSRNILPGMIAPVHTICNSAIPLHTPMELSIKTKPIPVRLQSKATIVWLDANNNKVDQKGSMVSSFGKKMGDEVWITARVKNFGRFSVALDTVAPSIRPYNISNNRNMSRAKIIGVIIGDNLTGIKSYRGTVDGKWIAMQFEYKNALLFYEFDEHVSKGKHTFQVEVTDGKDNVRTYKADFIR